MSITNKRDQEIVRRAMSILGKRMTPKRLKTARKTAAEMRSKLNRDKTGQRNRRCPTM